MPTFLLVGVTMIGLPLALIIGFAAYIFFGFINDDKDARAIFNIALVVMGLGAVFVLVHFLGKFIQIT